MPKLPLTKKHLLFFIILIFFVSAIFRFWNFSARTPFDWDQNRDYQKVQAIASGKFTLLGPIAKGDNGFYLGPLYYYLLTPGYLLTHGHPASFPVTSIVMDLVCLLIILILAVRRSSSRPILLSVALLWGFSWFIIENSRISWNVSLLPLWVILMFAFTTMRSVTPLRLFFYGLLAGLSWHIHASLIPLGLLFPLLFLPSSARHLRDYLLLGFGYLVALLPLLAFDLRHGFFNLHLVTNFAEKQTGLPRPAFLLVVTDVLAKLGRNTLGIFTGQLIPYLPLGLGVLLFALWGLFTRQRAQVFSGLVILLNLCLSILLFDLRFPEYYLAVSFLPTLYLVFSFLRFFPRFILWLSLIIFCLINLTRYTSAPTPYSLANKEVLVQAIASLARPISIRYELSPGREGGLVPLLNLSQVTLDPSAPTQVVVTDKTDGPVLIGGELTEDLIRIGGLRAAMHVVQ